MINDTIDNTFLTLKKNSLFQVGSLIIHNVNKRDSGNYSCSPSNSPPLLITLNVINGMLNSSLCDNFIELFVCCFCYLTHKLSTEIIYYSNFLSFAFSPKNIQNHQTDESSVSAVTSSATTTTTATAISSLCNYSLAFLFSSLVFMVNVILMGTPYSK